MVFEPVYCPNCHSVDVVRYGKTAAGKQRYRCRSRECYRRTFVQCYTYRGYLPEVKQQIKQMVVNGSGLRNVSRVLKVSSNTVTRELKKSSASVH